MSNQSRDLREINSKAGENTSQTRKEIYKIMYAKHINQIRNELTSKDRSDAIFQEAFVILLEKLEEANQMTLKLEKDMLKQ
ncbi:MAG: hypothetical protein IPL46_19615 [Saprospiraceae bacterium]|nr:hypothetical protein [Saprospiraceae bacterium]